MCFMFSVFLTWLPQATVGRTKAFWSLAHREWLHDECSFLWFDCRSLRTATGLRTQDVLALTSDCCVPVTCHVPEEDDDLLSVHRTLGLLLIVVVVKRHC